ncbi:hypothetical protein D3C84_1108340 [compost metagenome]
MLRADRVISFIAKCSRVNPSINSTEGGRSFRRLNDMSSQRSAEKLLRNVSQEGSAKRMLRSFSETTWLKSADRPGSVPNATPLKSSS